MKKLLSLLMAITILLSLSACQKQSDKSKPISYDSYKELETAVKKDIADTVSSLTAEFEELTADIDTYEKYLQNTEKIEAYYEKLTNEHELLCLRMYEYSANCAEIIISSGKSNDDIYDDLEDLYDLMCDDCSDDIYDDIYDGISEDMYDTFHDGIIEDAYDTVDYDEWRVVHSDEYDRWYKAHSDIYDDWSDYDSDVYELYLEMGSNLLQNDIEKAKETLLDFKKDIEEMKTK